jgi:hypothetical protein
MEKNIKMPNSTADNSAISRDRVARFALLERAFKATNLANIGFSTYGYSPVHQCLTITQSFSTNSNVRFF